MNFSRKPAATKSDFALHRAGAMVVDVVGVVVAVVVVAVVVVVVVVALCRDGSRGGDRCSCGCNGGDGGDSGDGGDR